MRKISLTLPQVEMVLWAIDTVVEAQRGSLLGRDMLVLARAECAIVAERDREVERKEVL